MAQRTNGSKRRMDAASRREQKWRFWRRTIDQWRRSQLTVRAFCERHGLSEPSFYYWRKQIGTADEAGPGASDRSRGQPASAGRSAGKPTSQKAAADDPTPAPSGAFAEVQVVAGDRPAGSAEAVVELILPGGERLRVEAGVTPEHLRRVLTAVREARGC